MLERERRAGQSGLQSLAAGLVAPLFAQKCFDEPRLIAVGEIGLHVRLGLRANAPRQRRTELQRELRQIDARHVLEAGVGGTTAIAQFAGAAVGPARDFWTAVQPDAGWLNKVIAKGNQLPPEAAPLALQAIAKRYSEKPPAASFRMIASPLVTWV